MNTSDTPARRSVYVRLHPRADHIQIHRTVEMLTTEDSEVQVDYGIGGEARGVEILGALDVEIDGCAASAAPETTPVDAAAVLGAIAQAAVDHRYGVHAGHVMDLATWVATDSYLAQAIARALTATPTEETRTDG